MVVCVGGGGPELEDAGVEPEEFCPPQAARYSTSVSGITGNAEAYLV
jgi:hypothetical protein